MNIGQTLHVNGCYTQIFVVGLSGKSLATREDGGVIYATNPKYHLLVSADVYKQDIVSRGGIYVGVTTRRVLGE